MHSRPPHSHVVPHGSGSRRPLPVTHTFPGRGCPIPAVEAAIDSPGTHHPGDAARLLQPPHHLRRPPHTPLSQSLTSRAAVLTPRRPSRPGQPKGRRGPGGRFRRRRLSSAQPHRPRPAPAAAGRSGSRRRRRRRRASRLRLWGPRCRGGARAAPGAGASALRSLAPAAAACNRARREQGSAARKTGREGGAV